MKLLRSVGDYFALDIGTTAVRVVQLSGSAGNWSLDKYGHAAVDIKVSNSDALNDQRKLGEVIMTVIGQSGIKARNVILGVPSDKMFATVIDLPDMPAGELASVIKYQAEQYIPMDINSAKVDWAMLGKSVNDPTKDEVLLASVTNSFSETRLDLIEGLGLNVIAIEPDPIALTRALLPAKSTDAHLLVEISEYNTDIVMTYQDAPRLIRTLPSGLQSLVKAATQNLNIDAAQASQFIIKFGVQQDKLEGQVYRALQATVDQFASEVEKSIKFFQTKYPSVQVKSIIASNYGVLVPGLKELLAEKVGLPVEAGNPWHNVRTSSSDEAKLQSLSAQFGVALGLAQRGSDE